MVSECGGDGECVLYVCGGGCVRGGDGECEDMVVCGEGVCVEGMVSVRIWWYVGRGW